MNRLGDVLLFMGPPGAGKGSLAALCAHELGWKQLSTGNLCRKHISEGTPLGKQIDFAIKSGKLISDELITDMVIGWLSRKITQTTVILDGFPRTVGQAEGLLALLRSYEGQGHLKVVRLSIENERVIERIVGRAVCSNKDCQSVYSLLQGSALAPRKAMVCDLCEHTLIRRSDDTVETIRERLSIYYSHEQNLLDFFKEKDQEVLEINVERPLKDVFTELKNRFIEKTV